jgi:hypothetical protein
MYHGVVQRRAWLRSVGGLVRLPMGAMVPGSGAGALRWPPHSGVAESKDRNFDRHAYKACHLSENFFVKRRPFRAIATRYDKTAQNLLAAVHFVAAANWLN